MDSAAHLFGRDRELEELRAALRSAESGRGGLALLVGEPGIGKTRLALAFADEAEARGARISWGRAWEAGGAPALWPWLEALRPLVKYAAQIGDAAAVPESSAATRRRLRPLAQLLPEWSEAEPVAPAGDAAQQQFRLFDAVATFLSIASQERPLVVILDDLHAADIETLSLLHFVARAVHGLRVVIIGTYRDAEARLSADTEASLARITREGRYLALGRLEREHIARWVAAEGHGNVDTLFSLSEGNPLFVAEMLRLSRVANGQQGDRLPDGVRSVIRARLESLSQPTRNLLRVASVLGRDVDLELAATLAELPITEARDLSREAHRANLFVDAGDRTRFTHILVREVLYEELDATARATLHAKAGRLLAQRHAANENASLAQAVHHLFAAAPVVPAEEALAWARRAADRATRSNAFAQAAEFLCRALELLPSDREIERCDLLVDLAVAQAGAGQSTRGREAAVAAATLARRMGDVERLGKAALCCGSSYLVAVVDRTLIDLLEEALASIPAEDSPLRARLLARLAAALQPAPDPAHPIELAREALAMSQRLGDDDTRRDVLLAATSALAYFADPRERLPLNAELIERARRDGDSVAVMRGLYRVVSDYLEMGDFDAADHAIAEYDRLTLEAELPMLRWRTPMLRAMRALMEGRPEDSERLCAEASAIAELVDDVGAKATVAIHGAARLLAQGRTDEVGANLPSVLEKIGKISDPVYTSTFRIGMLARIGRAAETRATLESLVKHDPPLRGRPMLVWAADACLALQDHTAAPILVELLEPLANRHFAWSPLAMVMEGPIADWVERLRELADRATSTTARPPPVAVDAPARNHPFEVTRDFELTRDGDVWTIVADKTFWIRDSRGMQILAQLVADPGREFHVTDLLAPSGQAGHVEDAGQAIDQQAIAAYKARLADLRDTEREATAHNDPERAARAREEMDAIAASLASSLGLGGRARRAASTSERARVNVRQRLKDAIRRIGEHSPTLAKHLSQTVRTGVFCSYNP